jgi:hypothetical protein
VNRSVPTGLARKLLFGRGWGVATFIMILAFVFLPQTECGGAMYDRKATATVTSVEKTNATENDHAIFRVHYTFLDDRGTRREGTSFTTDELAGTHEIIYVHADPDESRIVGTRSQPFGLIALVIMFTFLAFGIGGAFRAFATGRRWIDLLRHGTEATGRERSRVHLPSNDTDKADEWCITYAYPGGTHEVTTTDEHFPATVHLLWDANGAVAIEEMHANIRIDGRMVGPDPGFSLHWLVFPAATFGLAIATIVATMVR